MADPMTELAAALLGVQKELPRITKDQRADVRHKDGGAHSFRYAGLDTITEAIFPILGKHHLVWTCQPTMATDDRLVLRWWLIHAPSGGSWTGDWPLPATSPQTIGGNITYARRYALCAVVGVVADEDDDGQQAENELAAQKQSNRRARNRGQDPPPPFDDRDGADEPGSKTDLQRTRIMQAMGKMPRDVRLTVVSDTIGRQVSSVNDLSFNEAQKMLRRIEEERQEAADA